MEVNLKKVTPAGILVTLGIIFGDIGTSPLYTFQTILREAGSSGSDVVLGGISCVFWTLTLQTTFKYVLVTLQADNKGEGGVFSLYALVRQFGPKLYLPAIIGAGTLLADGIMTPPVSVSSAIEGLSNVKWLKAYIEPGNTLVVEIVLIIILLLFLFQRFGTKVVGASFGPIMLLWFTMLGVLGSLQIVHYPSVLKALSPQYGLQLLIQHPRGFWLMGAVFLCTTGAEALYSDLGHCGRKNIQVSWLFVKLTLMLNYMGQGAWVLLQHNEHLSKVNPFFAIVPHWFLIPSVLLATSATIIASQALISGSFTLISEAISLNFWPRVAVNHPTNIRGQIYIPSINWLLFSGCFAVVLYFRTSEAMTAAYGFSITVAMLMTTILMYHFLLRVKKMPLWIVGAIMTVFVLVESTFFVANAVKIVKRLMFLVVELGFIGTMYIWHRGRKINNRLTAFVNLTDSLPMMASLSTDMSVSKYATHLVYLTKANNPRQIESQIISSIFARQPKRADIYWFIHIDIVDDPFTLEYCIDEIADDRVIRVDFRLGFRVQPRINLLLRKVVEDMLDSQELTIVNHYQSPGQSSMTGDFRFVILEKFLSYENEFSTRDGLLVNAYFGIKNMAQSDLQAFGLDASDAVIEKIPLVIAPVHNIKMHRFKRPVASIDGE